MPMVTEAILILPGGGIHKHESKIDAVHSREVHVETGLTTYYACRLFTHRGSYNEHHVFAIQATGIPAIVDPKEAPAFAICREDLSIVPFSTPTRHAVNG